MPPIDVAMAQSLQHHKRMLDVLTAAVYPVLYRRTSISDVKTAFSSWDNCMNATYCKWPVIALIIIGGLILISVIWCIARCVCCGLSCCCECCYCLRCCGNCCGCCDAPRGKNHRYLDEPFIPPNHGMNDAYRSEPTMANRAIPNSSSNAKSGLSDTPQFATFDVGKKDGPVSDDALPAMPSWEGANHSKVLVEDDSMEMADLKKPEPAQTTPSPTAAYAAAPAYGSQGGYNMNGMNNMGGMNSMNNLSAMNTANTRQYSVSDYSDAGRMSPAVTGQFNSPRPGQGGYGMRSPPPQQPQAAAMAGYSRGNVHAGSYDDYRQNGTATPGAQSLYNNNMNGMNSMNNMNNMSGMNSMNNLNSMDTRSPRIPDVGMDVDGASAGYGAGAGTGASEMYGGMPAQQQQQQSFANGRPLMARPPPVRAYSPAPLAAADAYGNNARGNGNNGGFAEMPDSPSNFQGGNTMNNGSGGAYGAGLYEVQGSPTNFDNSNNYSQSMNNSNNSNNNVYGNAHEMQGSTTDLQNNAGFDFKSGYSRSPTQEGYGSNAMNAMNANATNNDQSFGLPVARSPPPLIQPQPQAPRAYPGGW